MIHSFIYKFKCPGKIALSPFCSQLLWMGSNLSCFAQVPSQAIYSYLPTQWPSHSFFPPVNLVGFVTVLFCFLLRQFFNSLPILNDSVWRQVKGFTWADVLENVVISIVGDMESLENSWKGGLYALRCSHLPQLRPRVRTFISLTTSWNSLVSQC